VILALTPSNTRKPAGDGGFFNSISSRVPNRLSCTSSFGELPMLKLCALLALAAAIACLPLAASAQTTQPQVTAQHHTQAHRPTGSHRSEMRHRGNMSRERARAGAEHVRTMHVQ
jgi:hypothetical protein